jgi:hypothetical protein
MTRRVKLIALAAPVATTACLAISDIAAASPIRECRHNRISPGYVTISNITSRGVDCRTTYRLATSIYRASVRHDLHSFRWGTWSVSVHAIPFAGTIYYDERSTASNGRVVRFQVYFE